MEGKTQGEYGNASINVCDTSISVQRKGILYHAFGYKLAITVILPVERLDFEHYTLTVKFMEARHITYG